MMQHFDILIVGAGHAGAQVAIALRQERFEGTIALLGEEIEPPYERPPLSKEYLSGAKDFERILIRPLAFWSERQITLLSGSRVTCVDAAAHSVTLEDGKTSYSYGRLVWATGGKARRLTCSGHHLTGVHTVRNRADVDAIMAELPSVEHVVVIGGGYIGLEAAAVLTKLGKQVTVVEALDRVLARVAGEPLSRFFETEHRAHGVIVKLRATVECIEENNGRATGVRLADGDILPADLVIVGIGIIPMVEPLVKVGAEGVNGVDVDPQGRTSLPDVFAIGDCARHANAFADGARIRLESVQNAVDQAIVVAKNICGIDTAYSSVPWFWSNQYDLRLQTIGLSMGYDHSIVRGNVNVRAFSLIYLKNGRVIAVDCVNSPKDFIQGRSLVVNRVSCDPTSLSDVNIPLKSQMSLVSS